MSLRFLVAFAILISLTTSSGIAQFNSTDNDVGITEHLNDTIPGPVWLVGENGDTVLLRSLIDKPTVLNFVYFRCPGICSPLMDGLADLIKKTDLKIGVDYQILTISFDPSESVDLARHKKQNYLNILNVPQAQDGWKFFVSDSASIARATKAVGFGFKRTGNDFLHSAGIVVLSPKGKITRYHYGTFFQPFEFKMSIIEASQGKAGPTINRVLQLCFKYDPTGKRYVLNITMISGGLILFFGLILFLVLVLKPVFKKKKKATTT